MTCTATRHGTTESAYTRYGCRCPIAIRARKCAEWRRSKGVYMTVDSTGTRRRLQALMRIGWSGRELMARIGWQGAALGPSFYGPRMHVDTAARVATLYAQLSDVRGPSTVTRRRAERADWPPPIAWDDDMIDDPLAQPWDNKEPLSTDVIDEVAVERAMRGEAVRLTTAEKAVVVHRLLARPGSSVTSVAHHLHMSNARVRELLEREEGAA